MNAPRSAPESQKLSLARAAVAATLAFGCANNEHLDIRLPGRTAIRGEQISATVTPGPSLVITTTLLTPGNLQPNGRPGPTITRPFQVSSLCHTSGVSCMTTNGEVVQICFAPQSGDTVELRTGDEPEDGVANNYELCSTIAVLPTTEYESPLASWIICRASGQICAVRGK